MTDSPAGSVPAARSSDAVTAGAVTAGAVTAGAVTAGPGEEDVPLLDFAAGLIGFPQARRFALQPLGDPDEGVFRLRGVDTDVEFVVAAPPVFFPGYAPEIDDEAATELGLTDASDAVTLVLLTLGEPIEDSTANLLAPVVVNTRTRAAAQVVLRSGDHDVRTRLVPAG